MTTTDKTDTLVSIDTTALADVTGGCAACGGDCARGQAQAPTAGVNPQQQNARSPWNAQS